MGNLAGATSALERAQRIEPGRAEVPYFLGVTRRREAHYDDALASFRYAVELAGQGDDTYIGIRARIAIAETLERMEVV